MSKLLAESEFSLIASPTLSRELGVPAAVFLQKVHYFLTSTKNSNTIGYLAVHKQRKWWYHSFQNLVNTLGLFSIATIKRAVSKLHKLGLIEIAKLDPDSCVNYYTINYQKLAELFNITPKKDNTVTKVPAKKPQTKAVRNPTSEEPSQPKIVGTDQPTVKSASHSELDCLPQKHRELFLQLRRFKVDVSCADPRLAFWCVNMRKVLAYASSAPSRLDIHRWQWHTPEQILPKEFLGITI